MAMNIGTNMYKYYKTKINDVIFKLKESWKKEYKNNKL